MRVPWTSSVAEESAGPDTSAQAPREPSERRFDEDPPPTKRWQRSREVDDSGESCCLNHMNRPSDANCADCREAFCTACCVTLQGQTLCGPCKDFRTKALRRPPQVSALAIISCALAILFAGPVSFCLPLISVTTQAEGQFHFAPALIFGAIAFALPFTALVLGLLALREIETKPHISGRPAALTGTIAAAVGVIWCLAVYAAVVIKSNG
jgi:hypothetical protein